MFARLSMLYPICDKICQMTKVKSGDVMQLHYALTESECRVCNSHLEWRPDFKDISRPRYVSSHCNYQYIIYIDDVKMDVKKIQDGEPSRAGSKDEPRARSMATA